MTNSMSKELLLEVRESAHRWRMIMEDQTASAAQKREFEAWIREDPIHEQVYSRASAFWSELGQLDESAYDPRVLKLAHERLEPSWGLAFWASVKGYRLSHGSFAVVALAVSVLIGTVFYGVDSEPSLAEAPSTQRFETAVAELQRIVLDDGSKVTLGAGSAVESVFSASAREVRLLSGVALFEVVHDADRSFVVRAGDLHAEALGTTFDVRKNGGVLRVLVAEGQVRVKHPILIGGRSIDGYGDVEMLTAGTQVLATRSEGLGEPVNVRLNAVGAWRDSRLIYASATLAELVADVRRHSHRAIAVDPILLDEIDGTLTASYDAADTDKLLISLPNVFPVEVEFPTDDTATIRAR